MILFNPVTSLEALLQIQRQTGQLSMDLKLERGVIRFMAVLFPQTRTGSEGELWEAEGGLERNVYH